MNLYWWTINTATDSGPTNYLVMAVNVQAARKAVFATGRVPAHHTEEITSLDPGTLTENEVVKI